MAHDVEESNQKGGDGVLSPRWRPHEPKRRLLLRLQRTGIAAALLGMLGVFTSGGSTPAFRLAGSLCNQPGSGASPTRNSVAMAVSPDGRGYWLMRDDGGIFPYGDAVGGLGSAGGSTLGSLMVAMASTPTGHGYWLVERRGMVWAFGDAGCHGGTYDVSGVQNIVAIIPSHSGNGYTLVQQNGGIWPFGDGPSYGCVPCQNVTLNDIVAAIPTPDGGGYWLMESNGGIWPYGDAYPCCGRATSSFPFVAIVAPPGPSLGYFEIDSIGGVYPIGSASGYLGSLPGLGYNVSDVSGIGVTIDGHGMYFERKNGQVIPIGNAENVQ